jgi:hypothetical protein
MDDLEPITEFGSKSPDDKNVEFATAFEVVDDQKSLSEIGSRSSATRKSLVETGSRSSVTFGQSL